MNPPGCGTGESEQEDMGLSRTRGRSMLKGGRMSLDGVGTRWDQGYYPDTALNVPQYFSDCTLTLHWLYHDRTPIIA